jgi:sortase A
MHRAGLVVSASVALLIGAACAGSSGDGVTATTLIDRTDASSTTVAPTLGLSPLPSSSTTVPLTTMEELPAEETTTAASNLPTTLGLEGPLPSPEPAPIPEAFEEENHLGQLEIPALSVSQDLYEGVTLTTLDQGPGHWPGTALPGQRGNVVIAGHRTSHTHPFRDIDKLKKGDQVVLTTAQGRNVYVVSKVQIISANDTWIVNQTPAKTATLFACHPKGSTAKRIAAFLTYAPELSQPTA